MKLIILDRDGVINKDSDEFIKSPEEFIPLPGSLEAIARLNHAGYLVMVATNQSGIGRGYFTMDTLTQIHDKLKRLLNAYGGRIDGIFFCPHGPDAHCRCRKPQPGLYEEIAQRLGTDLNNVPAVGDSLRDLQAAQYVGAKPILVRTGKGERTLAKGDGLEGIPVYADLAEYVDQLLEGQM
jgi:D-glycero-D-manno-heptose 1,7-bisphosphate phosphatase